MVLPFAVIVHFAPVSQVGRGKGIKIFQVPVRTRPGAPFFSKTIKPICQLAGRIIFKNAERRVNLK